MLRGVEENPYKAPNRESRRPSRPFLRLPSTIIEWVIIALVVIAGAALFLPDLDAGRAAARKRQSQNQTH